MVDVGAFVGDSTIFFALRGARRVIAIEPHPSAFKDMLENVRLNGFEGLILPINAGLVSRPGTLCVKDVDVEGTAVTYHEFGLCDTTVPTITLADVIGRYCICEDAILKIDCEGCEFDVIINDYEYIKVFKVGF